MAEYDAGKNEEKKDKPKDQDDVCKTALKRWNLWWERERENVEAAYEDLEFCWNADQWPEGVAEERSNKGQPRPMLTANQLPQFVHQITGDMRQMRPAIHVVAVDDRGDKETAETNAGLIRYIENRSDASAAYMSGADTQVSAGIGHWRVIKEEVDDTTFNQELRVVGVDDGISVAWDTDASLPTRDDAKWCILPVDISIDRFKEDWPDSPVEDFSDINGATTAGWFDKDFVRVAEYWVKKPVKKTLALYPNGSVVDVSDNDPEELAQAQAGKARIEKRDSYKICYYIITAAHVLEGPIDWPGRYIPIIPVIGVEIRIGRRIVRKGIVRDAKDTQRMFNYFVTAHTEVVGLQPKAPFIGTEKNFEKYQSEWSQANNKNFPFLPYSPDPANGGVQPARVQPAVSSQGILEGIALSSENLRKIIGIYDPSLGAKSNETSGKAIIARDEQGDTGTFIYKDNWIRSIKRTGQILIDLIPHVYDTERTIRIMGEDGKVDLKEINKAEGMVENDPETGEPRQVEKIKNDVTIGAYDVVLDTGPSYTTKRKEARDNMVEFIRSAPETAPAVLDLVAKSQDWPMADEFQKRLEAVAPPEIQKLIANQKKERGEELPPPEPPSPVDELKMAAAQEELKGLQLDNQKKQVEIQAEMMAMQQGPTADPVAAVKAQSEQQRMMLDARKAEMEARKTEMELAGQSQELEIKRQIAAIELEIKLADLALKKQGMELDTARAAMDLQAKQAGMAQEAERHADGLVQGKEKHQSEIAMSRQSHEATMSMGAQSHEAKMKQMQQRPERTST